MITRANWQALRDLGWRDTFIRTLKPQEALNIINAGSRPLKYDGGA